MQPARTVRKSVFDDLDEFANVDEHEGIDVNTMQRKMVKAGEKGHRIDSCKDDPIQNAF